MDDDTPLDEYRAAVRAYPELAAGALPPQREETASAAASSETPDNVPDDGRFPSKYKLVGLIAETGLSRTWKAWDQDRQTHVVIKEPRAHLLVDRDAEERFRGEVQFAARLMHPNIVPILVTHLSEPPWFFTMPFVEGQHLDEFCEDQQLSTDRRVELFLRVCDAVNHAHQHRVVHRDLKPNNILVFEEGEPQLLDFGLGMFLDAEVGVHGDKGERERVLGSPGYMAPEQAQGLPVDTRADVYALGVILYQLLTGRLPIEPSPDLDETLRRVCEETPLPPRELAPRLSEDLSAIVLKALAKQPAARYQSVSDLVYDIYNYTSHRPVNARRWTAPVALVKWLRRNKGRAASGGVALVAVLVFVVLFGVMLLNAARHERERHAKAMAMGRLQTARDDPVSASAQLWCGYFSHNSVRTRFALWEFYRQYPCLRSLDVGPQRDVEYSPEGKWLATVGVDGSLRICSAATGVCAQTLPPDIAQARCIKFASPPAALYVGGVDGKLRIWRFSSEQGAVDDAPLRVLAAAGDTINSLAVSPSGRWLSASVESSAARGHAAEVDTCVCLWDTAEEFTLVRTWELPRARVHTLAFSADEAKLAAATQDWGAEHGPGGGSVLLWELAVPEGPQRVVSTRAPCWAAAFSKDGQQLFCCADALTCLSLASEIETLLADNSKWGIRSVAVPDALTGRYLAFAGGDGRVRFYDVAKARPLSVQGFHDVIADHVDVCFSPNGETVASASRDGLRVWRFPPAAEVRIPCEASPFGAHVCISDDGQTVVVSGHSDSGDRRVFIWRRSAEGLSLEQREPSSIGDHLALSGDGRWLALTRIADGPPELVVADLSTPTGNISTLPVDLNVHCKPFWLDGEARVLLLACSDGALRLWRCGASRASRFSQLEVLHRFDSACTCVTADANSRWLAASAEGPRDGGQVALWRASGRSIAEHPFTVAYRLQNEFPTHAYTWNVALVTDSGDRLVAATSGSVRDVHLWDPETGAPLGPLCNCSAHSDAVFQCLPLDERLLVTASRDDTVRIWDIREREEVGVLYESSDEQPYIAMSNGYIAIADGGTVMVVDTWREIEQFVAGNRAYEGRRLSRD